MCHRMYAGKRRWELTSVRKGDKRECVAETRAIAHSRKHAAEGGRATNATSRAENRNAGGLEWNGNKLSRAGSQPCQSGDGSRAVAPRQTAKKGLARLHLGRESRKRKEMEPP